MYYTCYFSLIVKIHWEALMMLLFSSLADTPVILMPEICHYCVDMCLKKNVNKALLS